MKNGQKKRRLSGVICCIAALALLSGCARKPRPYDGTVLSYEGTSTYAAPTPTYPPLILTPIPRTTPVVTHNPSSVQINEDAAPTEEKPEYAITFLDVGQADCTIIREVGSDSAVLIDAGDADDSTRIMDYLKTQGITKLDYAIATHPHADHIGGMSQILYNYTPTVIMPLFQYDTACYSRVIKAIEEFELDVQEPVIGKIYNYKNSTLRILAPQAHAYEDVNDYSIAVRWECGNVSYVACGDAEETSEKEMLHSKAVKPYLNADIFKASHHGSSSSNSYGFIRAVSPEYVVVPCDQANSDDNLPNGNTLKRLAQSGAIVLRTDYDGTITFTTNGKEITYKTTK